MPVAVAGQGRVAATAVPGREAGQGSHQHHHSLEASIINGK